MSDQTDIPEDGALAAEFALGLLEGDERRAAEVRVRTDPAFAAEVAFWNERFAMLADEIAEESPPPRAKAALERRLFGAPERRGAGLWKALTGLGAVAAAAFAFLAFVPQTVAPPALFVSDIVSADASLNVLAVIDATAHNVRITRTAGTAREGRALELWGIPADGSPPVSFGVLPETEVAVFDVPDALLGKAVGLTLAISDEPPGGSPTGAPTGDVLATGLANRL